MRSNQYDFIIVGGGLAGSLLLSALQMRLPNLRYLLIEKSDHLGGNHTWSFHESDLPESSQDWLRPLISKSWASYEVHFPEYSRQFSTPYHSLVSDDLGRKINSAYASNLRLNTVVDRIEKQNLCRLYLNSGEILEAETVVLARGWASPESPVAWQKFVGLDVELEEPHGLHQVVLMDARVPQIDGFRFFYLLPWDERRLLIEDTYYSHHTGLKKERIELEIQNYIERRGWKLKTIERRESGALPLVMSLRKNQDSVLPEIPRIGAESGFFHPVTGYTVPTLLKQICAITDSSNLTMPSIQKALREVEKDAKFKLRYYRLLNRMLFRAAEPMERYKVLSHFYRMPESLIQRFYSGETNLFDQVRILMGRPPVPLRKAFLAWREE